MDWPTGAIVSVLFAGYPKLNGTPAIDLPVNLVDAIALASLLGSFLSAVHSFSRADAQILVFHMPNMDPRVMANGAVDELQTLRSVLETELVERCRCYLEDQIRANLRYRVRRCSCMRTSAPSTSCCLRTVARLSGSDRLDGRRDRRSGL